MPPLFFGGTCEGMVAAGCPAWALGTYCRATCGDCVPCSPPPSVPSPPMSPPSIPDPPSPPAPPGVPVCAADPLGLTAVSNGDGMQEPTCYVDDSGKKHCVVLPQGQSVCDSDVQRRLKKLWGVGIAGLVPAE